jgi:hypothetical protein
MVVRRGGAFYPAGVGGKPAAAVMPKSPSRNSQPDFSRMTDAAGPHRRLGFRIGRRIQRLNAESEAADCNSIMASAFAIQTSAFRSNALRSSSLLASAFR